MVPPCVVCCWPAVPRTASPVALLCLHPAHLGEVADPGQRLPRGHGQTMTGALGGAWLEAGCLGSGSAQGQRSVGRAAKCGVEKVVKEFQKVDFAELWKTD